MSEPTTAELLASIASLEARVASLEASKNTQPKTASPVRKIILEVAREYNVEPDDIVGPRRLRWIVVPRQEAMRRAVDAGLSLHRVARAMRRDHTTVLHGIRAARARLEAAE